MSGQPTPPPVAPAHAPAPKLTQVTGRDPFGAVVSGGKAAQLKGLNAKQIQTLLKARGYNVTVDGKMGKRTATAMDAYIKGKPPKQYNEWAARYFDNAKGGPFGAVVQGGKVAAANLGGGGSQSSPPKPKPAAASSGGGGGSLDPNVGTLTPESAAFQLGGLALDPQINTTQRALDMLPAQGAQNLHDISHWYQQVLDSEGTAATRDHDISQAGQTSVADAVAKIVSSLGGAANQGAGLVGAAGADAAGMLAATGAAQDQYNQDIQPLLRSESAGASTRETARQAQATRDLTGTLSDLKGQRGAAVADALMKIREGNNSLEQNAFQNNLSIEQTRLAGLTAGAKLSSALNTPAKGSFAGTSPTQKLGIMQTAVGAIYDPTTGKLKLDVPTTVQRVNSIIAGAGWDRHNPAVLNFRNQILQSVGIQPQPGWV